MYHCVCCLEKLSELEDSEQLGEEDSESSCSEEGSVSSEEEEGEEVEEMVELLQQMDSELSHTEVGKTFQQHVRAEEATVADGDEETPVDIDLNLVESLVQSYSSQLAVGEAGPASNLLHSMGLHLPTIAHTTTGQQES